MRLALAIICLALPAFGVGPIPYDRLPWTNDLPWSAAGVTGGIPVVTVDKDIVSDYGADNTGITACDTAVANAIAGVARGKAIYFPAGTYKLNSGVELTSGQSVVFRGAGTNLTRIKSGSGSSGNHSVFYFGGGGRTTNYLTVDALRGATQVVVSSTSGIVPGFPIWIRQSNDVSIIKGHLGVSTEALMSQHCLIDSTNATTLNLHSPLLWDYTVARQARIHPRTWMTNCGLEDMTIEQTGVAVNSVFFEKCYNCWVRSVIVTNSGEYSFSLQNCAHCTIEWSRAINSQKTAESRYGFQVANWTSRCLVQHNISDLNSSGFVTQGAASENVVAYNYTHRGNTYNQAVGSDVKNGSISHGDVSQWNLIEGNIGGRFEMDDFWGSNLYETYFRNWARGWQLDETNGIVTDNRYAWVIAATNYYHNIVGNLGNYPDTTRGLTNYLLGVGLDYGLYDGNTPPSIIIHRHWDFKTSLVTDSNGVSTTLPSSYYLSSKPAAFGNLTWPPIGLDRSVCTNNAITNTGFYLIPAQAIYYNDFSFTNTVGNMYITGTLRIGP